MRLSSPPYHQFLQSCEEDVRVLQDRDLRRRLTTLEEVRGTEVRVDGRWLVCWCSNDYLGLSLHPQVIRSACEAALQWGVGARASRLLAGSTALHAKLEDDLAEFFQAEAAAVFASGYLTNVGVLSALLGPGDLAVVDRLAHASILEACRASRATFRIFPHNDVEELARLLARAAGGRRMVVTEGVFSMDGDRAPLADLLEVTQSHEALLYVDDAHGCFVLGDTGRGSPEAAGVPHDAFLYMGTLGKALGCQGGFVVGPRTLIELLHNRARTFIYATALAVPVAAAAREALRIVRDDPAPRAGLSRNVQHLHARLSGCPGIPTQAPSHIVPVVVGSAHRTQELAAQLWARGILAPAIRPPTVPEGTSRLRLSVSALHTDAHIDALASALRELL